MSPCNITIDNAAYSHVILGLQESAALADWLNPANQDMGDLKEYLLPYDPALMKAYSVSKDVGNVKNQGPEVVEETSI